MTRFAALGDSITVGMGDPAPGRGGAALLASTLPQPELHNLATLGALAADVERVQLPAATALRPDVGGVAVRDGAPRRGPRSRHLRAALLERRPAAPERTRPSPRRLPFPRAAGRGGFPGRPGTRPRAVQPAADQASRDGVDGDQGHGVADPAVP